MVVLKTKLVTIAAAGTEQPILADSDNEGLIVGCVIQAHTGTIYVGKNPVDANSGIKLTVGQSLELPLYGQPVSLKTVYIDGATNGDKAIVLYFEKVGR